MKFFPPKPTACEKSGTPLRFTKNGCLLPNTRDLTKTSVHVGELISQPPTPQLKPAMLLPLISNMFNTNCTCLPRPFFLLGPETEHNDQTLVGGNRWAWFLFLNLFICCALAFYKIHKNLTRVISSLGYSITRRMKKSLLLKLNPVYWLEAMIDLAEECKKAGDLSALMLLLVSLGIERRVGWDCGEFRLVLLIEFFFCRPE